MEAIISNVIGLKDAVVYGVQVKITIVLIIDEFAFDGSVKI